MTGSADAPRWRDQTYTVPLGCSLANVGVWLAALRHSLPASSSASPSSGWGARAAAELLLGWQHAGHARVE